MINYDLVSLIMPCYNAEKYVAEAITSLLNQTYSNLEIIVVNDGSSDASETVIKSFNDSRIKYYKQTNKGQCAASNFGFLKSTGRYVKFYDADDVLEANTIAAQVETLKDQDDQDISFIEWRRFYNDKLPASLDLKNYHTIHRDCTPIEFLTFTGKTPIVSANIWLIPRSILIKGGLWDERISLINDTELFSRLLPYARKLRFSEKGMSYYRSNFNTKTLSSDISKKGIKSALLSIDLMAKWLLKVEDSERIKKIITNSYVMILEWAFPKQMVYVKIIERRIANYPTKYIQHTKSGKIYNLIMSVFGWKTASRLSKMYYKFRYNKR